APEPAPPPAFDVAFAAVQPGVRWIFNAQSDVPVLPPDWGGRMSSQIASQSPFLVLGGTDGLARLSVACSEATRRVDWRYGLHEEDAAVLVRLSFFREPEAPLSAYEVLVRLDAAARDWADAARAASDWICARPGYEPMPVPDAALDPLYSTWYGYHQDVHDADLEREFAEAAALGMKTLIVDDGWQTEDTGRGYAYCGDWQPAPSRFPDFRAHVDRVHALGMKYMIWYSVPFVGFKSRAAERFAGKFLLKRENMGAWVLDPRFPEVREHLASLYERAVRDWNLDGLKLDFIDSFVAPDPDPAAAENWAGRDLRSVPEAVLALMQEICRRLETARPGILIEFRQSYMGPAIRSFGNMIRAGDVPGDPLRNRARTARLRLTSGTTAVHSDMLEWNPRETPQQAAQQILSVLFSVIQYSMRLDRLPADHKRMVKHWIAWTAAHRDALLRGSFSPRSPELGYPLLEGASASERVLAVYEPGLCVAVPGDREAWIVNATDSPALLLDLAAAPVSAEAFDTFGDPVALAAPVRGLQRAAVPPSGLLRLRFA
ncbi:MAG: alpha-galactosidase, partial [Kiritimatiellae bacterium]|nr:alpha-galactosidase [Kiritimatiellia bacterium]